MKNQELCRKIEQLFEAWDFSGAAVVQYRGEILTEYYRDAAPDDHWFVGEAARSMTAAAALQLAQKGMLLLDMPVSHYLPQFPYPEVHVRHLLTMTSGLPDYFSCAVAPLLRACEASETAYLLQLAEQEGKARELPELLALIADFKLSFPPGTDAKPGPTDYDLLGWVLEAACGLPLERILSRELRLSFADGLRFGSSHMTHSGTAETEEGTLCLPRGNLSRGNAFLCATARGLLGWVNALRGAGDLGTDLLNRMREQSFGITGCGLEKCGPWYCASSEMLGHTAHLYFSLQLDCAFVLLSNREQQLRGETEHFTLNRNLRRMLEAAFLEYRNPKLHPITTENLNESFALRTAPEQVWMCSDTRTCLAQAYVSRGKAHPRLLCEGDLAVGFVMLEHVRGSRTAAIWKLLVDERFQGRGYGEAALRLAIAFCRRRKVREITLTVEPENTAALSLYQKYGFTPTGGQIDDGILMIKTI